MGWHGRGGEGMEGIGGKGEGRGRDVVWRRVGGPFVRRRLVLSAAPSLPFSGGSDMFASRDVGSIAARAMRGDSSCPILAGRTFSQPVTRPFGKVSRSRGGRGRGSVHVPARHVRGRGRGRGRDGCLVGTGPVGWDWETGRRERSVGRGCVWPHCVHICFALPKALHRLHLRPSLEYQELPSISTSKVSQKIHDTAIMGKHIGTAAGVYRRDCTDIPP